MTLLGNAPRCAPKPVAYGSCKPEGEAISESLENTATGPVAQWLEPAAHNGLVAGSSPARPTRITATARFRGACLIEAMSSKSRKSTRAPERVALGAPAQESSVRVTA